MKKFFFRWLLTVLGVITITIIIDRAWLLLDPPRLDREWTQDQQVLADVMIEENFVHVANVRNFDYQSVDEYTPAYYDATYDTDKLERVWYIIEPFGSRDGPAHTMLSFDFADGKHVSVSVEIRKEVGESFSALKWLFRQYEIVYMIGDERDLIRLRSNYREDDVYMYPIRTTPAGRKALFLDVMRRAQKLASDPEYYHTIFHTCTTVIQDHANAVLEDKKVRWSKDILLPKYSDTVAYDLGLIDTRLSLEEAREYYLINGRARQANQSEEFSELIRPEIR